MAVNGAAAAHQQFLTISEQLSTGQISESDLTNAVATLPPLSQPLLETLAASAQQASLSQPRRSWAIMATADAAAQQTDDLFLQSLAAWHLAWAANAWVRPQRVEAAVARAQAGFTALGREDWTAACIWQLNALPWTRPDYHQVALELEKALTVLVDSPLHDFAPDCRLALAFAHMLIGNFKSATALVGKSEQLFIALENRLGQARCQLLYASILRRQNQFDSAEKYLRDTLPIFLQLDAPIFAAQCYFQLSYIMWLLYSDFQAAEEYSTQALDIFTKADIRPWQALSYHGLAQIYVDYGRLQKAENALQRVIEIYDDYHLKGLQADALLDAGLLKLLTGDYRESIICFQQAAQLYRAVGYSAALAVCTMHEGEGHYYLGHYQIALTLLEKAQAILLEQNLPWRLAECEERLAAVWLALGLLSRADEAISKASQYFEQAGRRQQLAEIYHKRAVVSFHANQPEAAVALLHQAIEAADEAENYNQCTRSHRLLAEVLCNIGRLTEARDHLQLAEKMSIEWNIRFEQAAVSNVWGNYYVQIEDRPAAKTAWSKAIGLSEFFAPELLWRVLDGLATLASEVGNPEQALSHYHQAVLELGRLQRDLWQPDLAGSYLGGPTKMLDRAVTQAARMKDKGKLFSFIEESKAQTILRRMDIANTYDETNHTNSKVVNELRAKIRWLRHKIQEHARGIYPLGSTAVDLYEQLLQTVQTYDRLMAQLERATSRHQQGSEQIFPFTISDFYRLVEREGFVDSNGDWLAVSYYQDETHIYGVMVSPSDSREWSIQINPSIHYALKACTHTIQTQRGRERPTTQLAILGNVLFPDFVQANLTPETTVLIAPHRQLHRLPWATLLVASPAVPLAMTAVPVILPSLKSLAPLLAQSTSASPTQKGLVVALSEFEGRHPRLPEVFAEVTTLVSGATPDAEFELLLENEATFYRMLQLANGKGLGAYRFLHIATHAFTDQLTGRLSGLALADQDVLLDELWQLAPLPSLVMFSSCSGLASRIYEGDEPVGLPIRCLLAGAQRVIGSLWPVVDNYMPDFISQLYQHLRAGVRPARALALAQRKAHLSGIPWNNWGSFQCMGLP